MKTPWKNTQPNKEPEAMPEPPVSQLRDRVNWAEESENIRASIGDDDGIMMLCADKDDTIIYDVASGRELRFRLAPHTEKTIREILHIGRSVNMKPEDTDILIGHLIALEPELLMNLRGIIIAETMADIVDICKSLDILEEEIPDKLKGDNPSGLTDNVIGLQWYVQSMVVLNLHAMKKTADELCEDGVLNYDTEMRVGFWVTLLHEMRHNQIDACVYEVPWLKQSDALEDNVEAWAREKYESLFE